MWNSYNALLTVIIRVYILKSDWLITTCIITTILSLFLIVIIIALITY